MLQRITSLQNEKLKNFARLYRRKYREKWKLYVAEGINLVEEALKNGAEFDSAFVREDFFGFDLHAGDVLMVEMAENKPCRARFLAEETEARKTLAKELMQKLKRRS